MIMLKGLLALAALLGGCLDKRKEENTAKSEALTYYRKKYNDRKITLEETIRAGNSGLFGYIGVKNRAYKMSDGYWVYHADGTDIYADNRQAEEIQEAFDREIIQPLVNAQDMITIRYDLARTGMDSFDECIYTEYYDGDIRSFCEKEKPQIQLEILLEETAEEQDTERGEEIFRQLSPYVRGWGDIYIVKQGTAETYKGLERLHGRNPDLMAVGYPDFTGGKMQWYRQKYIEVTDGIYMTSAERDLVLEDGDIVLVQEGTCADIQAILDEKYYAMPVDAPENKKGGYTVHDQRHEKRAVLDDPEAPCYKPVFSEKITAYLQEHDDITLYVRSERTDDKPLMKCYGSGSYTWNVYRVCENGSPEASYETMKEGYLYYFGTQHYEAYEDK